jgi:hypothetical protein
MPSPNIQQQALEVVEKFNLAVDTLLDVGASERDQADQADQAQLLYLQFTSNSWVDSISFLGQTIWDTEMDRVYDANDQPVDLEALIHQRVRERLKTVARFAVFESVASLSDITAGH